MDEEQKSDIKREYLKSLYGDYKYSIERFDHQSLYISGGALALSLTFLDSFIKINEASWLFLFIGAIISFVLTIGLGFYAHYKSAQKIDERINKVKQDDYSFSPDTLIKKLNKRILISLMTGLILLISFCIVNLFDQKRSIMEKQSTEKPAVTPKAPEIERHSMPVQDPPQELLPDPEPAPNPEPSTEPDPPTTTDD